MESNSDSSTLFGALARDFDGDIDTSPRGRSLGSVDKSFVTIPPQAIAYPKTIEDLSKLFLFAKEYRMPLSFRGNGKSSSGGSLTEGMQIDMSRHFGRVERVDIKNNLATIQSGASIASVAERLEKIGVFCPLLSKETYEGTVGGLVSLNASTCSLLSHGETRLWVEGLRVVLDDGKEYEIREGLPPTGRLLEIYTNLSSYIEHDLPNMRASMNSRNDSTSGYNVWGHSIGQRKLLDIIVGSEGTLCVITAVTLRILPLVKHAQTLMISIRDNDSLKRTEDLLCTLGADSVFLFDTRLLALAPLDDQSKLPLQIRNTSSRYVLSATFIRKTMELAHGAAESCKKKLLPISAEISTEEGMRHVSEELSFIEKAFALHLARTKDLSRITTLDSVTVDESSSAALLNDISSLIDSYGYINMLGCIASPRHVSIIFFAETTTREGRLRLNRCLEEAVGIIKRYGGSLTGGNGDGIIRTPYIEASTDKHMRNAFSYIQRLFDPEQIFNIGKKTFYTTEAIEHYLHRKASN